MKKDYRANFLFCLSFSFNKYFQPLSYISTTHSSLTLIRWNNFLKERIMEKEAAEGKINWNTFLNVSLLFLQFTSSSAREESGGWRKLTRLHLKFALSVMLQTGWDIAKLTLRMNDESQIPIIQNSCLADPTLHKTRAN